MPLSGTQLVVEPSYPKARELMEITAPKDDSPEPDFTVRSSFWSTHKRADIFIVEMKGTGKIDWSLVPGIHSLKYSLETLSCCDAWGVEQESNAVHLLGTLVSHRQFKQYMLTGMFAENSKRSGLTYIFRRLKPTIAIQAHSTTTMSPFCRSQGQPRIIATLCMHPIAHYKGSWAGAMCPTDDVVAHLMLMRGDEPLFWRRANQHEAYRPEAGL